MMAKKILALFMAVLMALSLTATALADVVWEPRNSFYETHHSQCTYLGRSYYANGPDGFVTLWDAPGGSTVAAQYENGTALSVYWTYKNWGCITVWEGKNREEVSGWVPMEQLYLIYDHISFEEEYGAYFKPYDGQFDGSGLKDGDEIWCVFDCDDNSDESLRKAMELANKLGYGIAFSNPCFEYWYLLHFAAHNGHLKGADEVIRLLRSKGRLESYEKNQDVFATLLSHQSEAINRAQKRLEQLYKDGIVVLSRNSNPATTVHHLVEYLNKQNQK